MAPSFPTRLAHKFHTLSATARHGWRTVRYALQVARSSPRSNAQPVIFFNASARISGLSLNAAFSLVTSWILRLNGTPVVHFVCRSGMSRCLLGTDESDPYKPMPCRRCVLQSRLNYASAPADYFTYHPDLTLARTLASLDLPALMRFELPFEETIFPVGLIVLPSVRWRLRRKTLVDDESTRFLYRQFILSAWNVLNEFDRLLQRIPHPRAVVIFNALVFPEAAVDWLAKKRGLRVIAHEISTAPLSAFFTAGDAPSTPIPMPASFNLTPAQESRLDELLEKRFQGKFLMGGIRFYPEIRGLDESFLQKAARFRAFVPIFTNVIFDTSQERANVLFPDMFAWLDAVLETARRHPETLFVLRAHPDEFRPGKYSRESVAMWVEGSRAAELPNFLFVPPTEYISSYDLIQRSKFVMIYNSTIGLEASILGKVVLGAGSARYTGFNTILFPASQSAYLQQLEALLSAGTVEADPAQVRNARRFFYYAYYRASLPFGEFMELTEPRGYVKLKPFDLRRLSNSPTARVLLEGILRDGSFMLQEDGL